MSQSEKSAVYQALKSAGVDFEKHYREYSLPELEEAHAAMVAAGQIKPLTLDEPPTQAPPTLEERGIKLPPVAERNPNEMAGERQNTLAEDEPLRIDPETGWMWYQEEVQKAATPKPRGRRVLKYEDSGFREESAKIGDYVETFEVPGNERRISEVKVTLPSFQVGIYRDPRHPFKTIVYNGTSGFDLFDIEGFYGGADMVPEDVKRIYVANTLCYDIRTVIRNIETADRQIRLAGKVLS